MSKIVCENETFTKIDVFYGFSSFSSGIHQLQASTYIEPIVCFMGTGLTKSFETVFSVNSNSDSQTENLELNCNSNSDSESEKKVILILILQMDSNSDS